MNNSIKTIVIDSRAFAKRYNLGDIYTKKQEVKKNSLKCIETMLTKAILPIVNIPFEIKIPSFTHSIVLKYDWDMIKFDKNSEYYNVYDFDSYFKLELYKVIDVLIDAGIAAYSIMLNPDTLF